MNAIPKLALFLTGLMLMTACATQSGEQLGTRTPLTSLPQNIGFDAGEDTYADSRAVELSALEDYSSTRSDAADSTSTEDDIFAEQKASVGCISASKSAIDFSARGAKDSGSASIIEFFDLRLEEDWWSKGVTTPPPGEIAPLVKCTARVRWSNGWDSDLDLWYLLDSDDNLRIRWDNVRNWVEVKVIAP